MAVEYVPAGHTAMVLPPAQYAPAGHAWQVDAELAPVAVEYVPAGHV
ncbi:MAG: hypothetical protein ACOZQL_37140 [Myxococcota bacterium]